MNRFVLELVKFPDWVVVVGNDFCFDVNLKNFPNALTS